MERDDKGLFGLATGDGIEQIDDFDLSEVRPFIVNLPVTPTRRFFCVDAEGFKDLFVGAELLILREDETCDRRVVAKLDPLRNLVELEKPMTGWPMLGGRAVRIIGCNRHYVNLKQMEQVKKCILQGGVLLDKGLLNGKGVEEVVESLDC